MLRYVSAHSILDGVVVPGDMMKILLLSFVRCVKPAHYFMYLIVNLLPYYANRAPTQQASCGTCGGEGCSGRGNGQNSCCTKNIAANGETCSTKGAAPCVMDGGFGTVDYWDPASR